MGDDPNKRDKRKRAATDHSKVAPTRAFKQQPTEVLDLPPPDPKKLVDPNAQTRRTAMQKRLIDDDDLDDDEGEDYRPEEFEDPAGTELLGAHEHPRLSPNVTAPEAFEPPALDSDMRALHEVARLPTAVHQSVSQDPGEPSDTNDDARGDLPSGFDLDDEESNPFESPTDAFAAGQQTGEHESAFSETVRTAEEDGPSAEQSSEESPAGAAAHADPEQVQGAYYEEIQGAFNASPVFDPRTVANTVLSDDAFKPRASADWPELSLDNQPPAGGHEPRSPFFVLGVFLAVLVVTIGVVGVAFSVLRGGDDEEQRIWGDLVEKEKAARAAAAADEGDEANEDPGDDDDEAVASDEDPNDDDDADDNGLTQTWRKAARDAAAPGLAGVPSSWKRKIVNVKLARADDTSKSELKGLDDRLARAFAATLKEDGHARWRLRNRRMRSGWVIHLVLTDLQIASGSAETVLRASCRAIATPRRMKRAKLTRDVDVEQTLPTPSPDAPRADLARDLARACGYQLGWDFVLTALD